MPVPAALKPIIGFLILLSHNFLNFCASESFLVYLVGRGEIILFLKMHQQVYLHIYLNFYQSLNIISNINAQR